MKKPIVSVIMANYNTPTKYLKEAVDSILNQTYRDFEFIIVDDASTDGSLDFIKTFDDDRIVIIENEVNLGLTKSLNKALSVARGKYIARMDSDDIALRDRFKKQVEFMDNNTDVIVCGTWFEKFGKENCIRKPKIADSELYRCQLIFSNTPITICHPSVMMRKSMLDENGIRYDETIKKAQDYALWATCSRFGKIAILEEVLLKYRTHESQISTKQADEQKKYTELISERQLGLLGIKKAQVPENAVKRFIYYRDLFEEIIEKNQSKQLYSENALRDYKMLYLTGLVSHMRNKDRLSVMKQKDGILCIGNFLKSKIGV